MIGKNVDTINACDQVHVCIIEIWIWKMIRAID